MFKIAEQYYNILEKFTKEYTPSISRVPLDEDRIIVDLDSRAITLPDSLSDFFAIAEDHRSQTVYFEVDRYFEDVDLASITCAIEYINPANQLRLYPVTLKDIDTLYSEKKMILAWSLGSEATSQGGTLKFALHFFKTNHETKTLAYSLHTLPCEATILNGMEAMVNDKQQEESEDRYEVDNFMYLVDLINQKNVFWNDL